MDKEIKLQKKDVMILIESLPKVKDSVQQCRDILLQAGFENVSSILAAFLLVDNTGNSRWYFVCNDSSVVMKVRHERVLLTNPRDPLASLMLKHVFNNELFFSHNGRKYKIVSWVMLNKELYSSIIEQGEESVLDRSIDTIQIDTVPVYVYSRLNNKCTMNNHNIETVTAETTDVKTGCMIHVNVYHCMACQKYFVNYEALQSYISRGIYPALQYELVDTNTSGLRESSELMLYGYSVKDGELTKAQRQRILAWIIDAGLLSKNEVIKDLQFKVRYNGAKKSNASAKSKWQEDILFVSQYTSNNTKKIKAVYRRQK